MQHRLGSYRQATTTTVRQMRWHRLDSPPQNCSSRRGEPTGWLLKGGKCAACHCCDHHRSYALDTYPCEKTPGRPCSTRLWPTTRWVLVEWEIDFFGTRSQRHPEAPPQPMDRLHTPSSHQTSQNKKTIAVEHMAALRHLGSSGGFGPAELSLCRTVSRSGLPIS